MIGIPEFFEAAREHELLKRFEPRDLERLAGLAREAEFKPDQTIFRQGEKTGIFYLIIQGSVVLEAGEGDRRMTVQTLHPGDAMGWSAVTDSDDRAHFAARALEPSRAIAFDGVQLRAACDSHPTFGYVMMKALLSLACERLDATRAQMSS